MIHVAFFRRFVPQWTWCKTTTFVGVSVFVCLVVPLVLLKVDVTNRQTVVETIRDPAECTDPRKLIKAANRIFVYQAIDGAFENCRTKDS